MPGGPLREPACRATISGKTRSSGSGSGASAGPSRRRRTRARPKYYVLEMFPYPSGKLHVGHVRNYTMGDLVARYRRAQGYSVLHPMGWDAFGLPAENAAIAGNTHPAVWTEENIATMRGQMQRMGFAYDWSREIATCHPEYYRHEQKMFLDFLAAGLAYRRESWVNWDPVDHTVLANEQVIDGRGWRTGALVEKRLLSQWFLRITEFSEELLDALKTLDRWPERVRLMQENWIGRSEGARVVWHGAIAGARDEHDRSFHDAAGHAVRRLVPGAVAASSAGADTGGERSGIERIHRRMRPARHQRGGHRGGRKARLSHGARSGAPVRRNKARAGLCRQFRADGIRHRRDFRLPGARPARPRFRAQIRAAGHPGDIAAGGDPATFQIGDTAYVEDGVAFNSDFLNGLRVAEAKRAAGERLEELGRGTRTIAYRLRDWGVSRQRYWGCPIPVIHCPDCGIVPVPEDDLPVELPRGRLVRQAGQPARPPSDLEIRQLPVLQQPGDARDRHVRHVLRIVLVFPPVLLGARAGRVRPQGGRILDAGRSVYRRRRARRPAPAVFALFHAGPEAVRLYRHRGAVCRPVHAGHGIAPDLSERRRGVDFPEGGRFRRRREADRRGGASGDGRPARKDEQVEEERRRSR